MLRQLARAAFDRLTLPNREWFTPPPISPTSGVELTYLGTAGFVLRGGDRIIVLDPYVTRTGLRALVTRPLVSNQLLLRKIVPRAHDVLVGHTHFDHVLDAPALCKKTGARLIGSRSACMVGRAAQVPESQLVETAGREDIACGPFTVRGLPSLHGKALFGRVPLPGDIDTPPAWPPRAHALKHGLVLNWYVASSQFSLVHIDSAEFIREELHGLRADIVCLCAIGRRYRPDYVREVVELLRPKYVVPCHWDTMLTPIEEPARLIPAIDLAGMLREIRAAGAVPVPMQLLASLRF